MVIIADITFNGDVVGTVLDEKPAYLQRSVFYGDRLLVELSSDSQTSIDQTSQLSHISITGSDVRFVTTRKNETESLGGTQLNCSSLDYYSDEDLILANGPGEIIVNNAASVETGAQAGKFDIQKPCYAYINGFDDIKWHLGKRVLTAESKSAAVHIGYLPVLSDGSYGNKVLVDAGKIIAEYDTTDSGSNKLSTLRAIDGITYSETPGYNFAGSELYYQNDESLIRVNGSKTQPCLLNGAMVDGIEYDLSTGRAKAVISSPGSLRLR